MDTFMNEIGITIKENENSYTFILIKNILEIEYFEEDLKTRITFLENNFKLIYEREDKSKYFFKNLMNATSNSFILVDCPNY